MHMLRIVIIARFFNHVRVTQIVWQVVNFLDILKVVVSLTLLKHLWAIVVAKLPN